MKTKKQISTGSAREAKFWYRWIPASIYVKLRAHRTRAKSKRRGEHELRILEHLIPRDRVAVDVGANRGVYSYFMSKWAPRVVAYEPTPAMADFLRNARLPGVEVRQKAVCDRPGKLVFSVPIDRQGRMQFNVGRIGKMANDSESFEVEGVCLDDEDLGDVGFMKIDVEGHEAAVLRGARGLLAKCQPVVLLEILGMAGRTGSNEVLDLMQEMGYCACVYDGNSILPLGRAKLASIGRNFLFFPSGSMAAGGGSA